MLPLRRSAALVLTWLLVLILESFAQHPLNYDRFRLPLPDTDPYLDALWSRVDSLLDDDLPESASATLDSIYSHARSRRIMPHLVKSIVYRSVLAARSIDDDEAKVNGFFQSIAMEITSLDHQGRAVLNSIRAEMIWTFWSRRRWRSRTVTEVENDTASSITTWSPRRIVDTADAWFTASLESADLLARTPIRSWAPLLSTAEGSDRMRPSLLDLLAWRSLEFLTDGRSGLPRPEKGFTPVGRELFRPTDEFVALSFPDADPLDPTIRAIKLLQMLARIHRMPSDRSPLIDLEINRLAWAARVTANDSSSLYHREGLETLANTHRVSPAAAEAYHALSVLLVNAQEYVRALGICDSVIASYPVSRGAVNCRAVAAEIRSRSVAIMTERTVPPNRPCLASVSYKNIDRLYLRVTPASGNLADELYPSFGDSATLARLISTRTVAAWEVALPDSTHPDYRTHTVDLKVPPLPAGSYVLMASIDARFPLDSNQIACVAFTATRLSVVVSEGRHGTESAFIRDAVDGRAIPGATVRFMDSRWDSKRRRRDFVEIARTTSTARGWVRVPSAGNNVHPDALVVDHKDDRVAIGGSFYVYAPETESPVEATTTILFTDRSIYRPGQVIYVKGIVVKGKRDDPDFRVAPRAHVTLSFLDANGEQIDEFTTTTNDFGSFSATLTAPATGLTGQMSLRVGDDYRAIRIEEYKRPKFEATFEPVTGSYFLGNPATVRGSANAYAGSVVDGAQVRYTVTRDARFPYWFAWGRSPVSSPQKQITSGTTTTGADGSFEVTFNAEPDPLVPRSSLPVFTFTVTADVVDVNGETHTATTSISAGFTSTLLAVDVVDVTPRGETVRIGLRTSNLSGSPVPFTGYIVIERLRPPTRLTRTRVLPRPDRFAFSSVEFARTFPVDPYDVDSSEITVWSADGEVVDRPLSIPASGVDSVTLSQLPVGAYRVRFTGRDPGGDSVRVVRHFKVYTPPGSPQGNGELPYPVRLLVVPVQQRMLPGQTYRIRVGSSLQGAVVVYAFTKRDSILASGELPLNGSMRELSLRIVERHRGGVGLNFFLVYDGRIEQRSVFIDVPWTNKELRVEASTFREKLRPGQEEEWRFTVRGSKGEQVAAEMVAAMYDGSLDAIHPNTWPGFAWPIDWDHVEYTSITFRWTPSGTFSQNWNVIPQTDAIEYDRLMLLGGALPGVRGGRSFAYKGSDRRNGYPVPSESDESEGAGDVMVASSTRAPSAMADSSGGRDIPPVGNIPDRSPRETAPPPIRRNLQETAFFFPMLRTNDQGETVMAFTVPEALTRWHMNAFAHTTDMRVGALQRTAVTQKELMVLPNLPRFMREGDTIFLSTKISNIADRDLAGSVTLSILDASSYRVIDSLFSLQRPVLSFSTVKGGSTVATWRLVVPSDRSLVLYKIVASSGDFSDGEEGPIPILPNRMLVTETMPITVRARNTREYELGKLLQSATSTTLTSMRLTLEMTSNPAWYAVQSLPYIIEYPYECAEQTFNRYYANAIASHIVRSNPRIKGVFDQWRGTDALVSALEKNSELKELLLLETPWVMAGRNETERKQRIALLFDLNTMGSELTRAAGKLAEMQREDGSFGWFTDMPGDRYMTAYIVNGIGRMKKLGLQSASGEIASVAERGLEWLDREIAFEFDRLRKSPEFDSKADHLGYLEIQYLYARGYFSSTPVPEETREALDFWIDQARRYWTGTSPMGQGMIALALNRLQDTGTPRRIIASLRERMIRSEELGSRLQIARSWWWYESPIETQTTLIELFDEVASDRLEVDEMKLWLLKQKQTQDWGNTRATADACYALLLQGTDFLASGEHVVVTVGNERIDPLGRPDTKVEAGTGYYSVAWSGAEIRPEMGKVSVTRTDDGIAWGALYWQYFERLDRITFAESPLRIEKRLFRKKNTSAGPVLVEISEGEYLDVGDAVISRIIIRTDREMEYVHLKDMRGSSLDPVSQLSRYRWQGGLGYYEAPGDASTSFFISRLPKGTWVFEYETRATIAGTFSNGISTIQSMYAPEFAAHTSGIVIRVK